MAEYMSDEEDLLATWDTACRCAWPLQSPWCRLITDQDWKDIVKCSTGLTNSLERVRRCVVYYLAERGELPTSVEIPSIKTHGHHKVLCEVRDEISWYAHWYTGLVLFGPVSEPFAVVTVRTADLFISRPLTTDERVWVGRWNHWPKRPGLGIVWDVSEQDLRNVVALIDECQLEHAVMDLRAVAKECEQDLPLKEWWA